MGRFAGLVEIPGAEPGKADRHAAAQGCVLSEDCIVAHKQDRRLIRRLPSRNMSTVKINRTRAPRSCDIDTNLLRLRLRAGLFHKLNHASLGKGFVEPSKWLGKWLGR